MPTNEIDILLVEDNPADVELTLHALRQSRLANPIHVVRDGEEALEYLFAGVADGDPLPQHPPKLVLLDLKLPKIDGMEVLRAIKGDPRTKVIPVVVLTTSREEKDVLESYNLGVNSYIQKPVDFEQFREVVSKLSLYWLVVNEPPPANAFSPK